MNYLVTGGIGLVGARIVRDLSREGNKVVVYDFITDQSGLDQILTSNERELVKVIRGDVTDLAHLLNTVKQNNIEGIIHLAGLLSDASRANPPMAVKVNCEGTINIFETARILDLKKVVWSSTIGVFGPANRYSEEYIPNDAPHYPGGIYAACKSLNERIMVHYCDENGLDITAIRYSVIYGPGQRSGETASFFRELIEKPALGKPSRVPYGDDFLSCLYVDDASKAAVLAAKTPKTKTKAFTATGEHRSVKELVDYVRKLIPGSNITLVPGYWGLGTKYETTPIKEQLGFYPEWSMEKGIKETINIIRKQNSLPTI